MKLRQAVLIGVVPAGYFGAQTAAGGFTPPFIGFLVVVGLLTLAGLYRRKKPDAKPGYFSALRHQMVHRAPEDPKPVEEKGSVFGTPRYTVHNQDDFWRELPDPEMII